MQKSRTNVCLYLQAAQAAIADKAAKKCCNEGASDENCSKSFIDDETRAKLEEAAKKAEEIARDLAEQSLDVAKSGLEALKVGFDAAIKTYKDTRNK